MGRQVIHIVTFLSILLFSSFTHADEAAKEKAIIHEIKLGFLAHDVDNLWSSFKREEGEDVNIEAVFSSVGGLFGGHIHPVLGTSINTRGYTSKLYFDGIWRYYLTDNFYGAFGLGITIHDGEKHLVSRDRKALGSQVLFHIPIEIGYTFYSQFNVSVYFDHISSAGLTEENEGLDTLGVRLGYTF